MAINIVPKSKVELKTQTSSLEIFYYLMFILLFITLAGYFVLGISSKKAQEQLEETKAALSQKRAKEVQKLETEILIAKEKIDLFLTIFDPHKKSSNFFDFLKQNCHKKVFFSETKLDTEKNEAEISGRAESFKILGEQILIFRKQAFVKNLALSSTLISREGGIEFALTLSLDSEIFK